MVSRELYLFFLTNKQGHSYYVENGIVKARLEPTWLPEAPDGWLNTELSFARNAKYYGLNRSFTNPVKFVGDGATIIRYLFYTGKGVEQELFLNINKWNDLTGKYDHYYKGGVDLSKMNDEAATGVTVNLLESGLLQMLKANENNVYEIPCNGSIPQNILTSIDGILFKARYNYLIPAVDLINNSAENCFALPIIYQNADGDSIGIIKNDQTYEQFNEGSVFSYVKDSANYFFQSIAPIVPAAGGKLKFTVSTDTLPTGQLRIYYFTSKDIAFPSAPRLLFNQNNLDTTKTYELDLGQAINLAANEKLFLIIRMSDNPDRNFTVHIKESTLTLDFDSRYKTTQAWGITYEDAYKFIVDKISAGKYQGVSSLLNAYRNLVLVSGMSLRNSADDQGKPNAVIKISLSDLFISANAILNASLGNEKNSTVAGEHLFLERKKYVFDPSAVSMNLGEVSGLTISVADQYFANNLKIGYAEQKYDEKQGNLEYNTTSQYQLPVQKFTKDFQLISKIRGDSYGVEYTRYLTPGNNTVNNKSDNDVFVINVEKQTTQLNAAAVLIDTDPGGGYFSITGATDSSFTPNQKFIVSGTAQNNGVFTVKSVILGVNVYNVYVHEAVATEISDVTFRFETYKLLRENYTSISGVVNPQTAYNIKDLTPGRMVRAHGNYFRGIFHNQTGEYLKFLTSDKNKELVTLINGQTIIEKMDIQISSLDSPLFYPYIFTFRTQVPITFEQIMTGAANGHIHFTYNGISFYGFPIEVSVKPSLNDVQEWKLLVSPMTNIADLQDLDINGLNFINAMGYSIFVPHLCPVKFVPLGATLPAQYHFKHMDDWWFSEQIQMYAHQPRYFAKWQNNDAIEIQVQTNGLGPVQIEVLNAKGEVQNSIALAFVNDPAITAPQILYEGTVDLSTLAEGAYYLHLTAGVGADVAEMISEPLHIKADWPDTLLIKYSNKKNKQACIFTTGYNPSFRVEGWIDTFKPEAQFTTHINQPADIELLNGIPYRTHKLNIGFDQGHPDWVFDKLNRITLLNRVLYDGEQYSRDSDAKWEAINIPGSPLKFSSLQIRPAKNRDGVSVSTDGAINEGTALTVVYDIETNAFGDGAGSSNVVRVTKVDD